MTHSPRPLFVNSGPVLEESVHTTAVEQFKAGSPSGQGDWAVMKIPQERSKGNSMLLFVMGKRRRQRQEGSEAAVSEGGEGIRGEDSVCVCVCLCSGGQAVPPNINETEKERWKGREKQTVSGEATRVCQQVFQLLRNI